MKENIRAAKREYYFKTFTAQKRDMKKTWKTIDETLNRRKNKSKFPSEFIVNNRSITDHKEIADQFNIFFSNIGSTLSDSIEINDNNNKVYTPLSEKCSQSRVLNPVKN